MRMIYFLGQPQGGDLFYVRLTPAGEAASRPLRVDSQEGSVIATGTILDCTRMRVTKPSGQAEPLLRLRREPGGRSLGEISTEFEPALLDFLSVAGDPSQFHA